MCTRTYNSLMYDFYSADDAADVGVSMNFKSRKTDGFKLIGMRHRLRLFGGRIIIITKSGRCMILNNDVYELNIRKKILARRQF